MRRSAPPPTLRVDSTDPGPWAEVARSPRGLGLVSTPPPDGEVAADERVLRPTRGMPHAAQRAQIVNNGATLVTTTSGLARTYRLPDLAELFDRRPPGLDDVRGAFGANAALLRDDTGWRAVVLPSMGDLAADLGPGPIAIRGDGRRLAVVHEGALYDVEIPGAATTAVETPATPSAVAFAADGTVVAAYGAGLGEPGEGSPIVELVTAGTAARALSRHEDGTIRLWDLSSSTELASWTVSLDTVTGIALDAEGRRAAIAGSDAETPVARVVDAETGVPTRNVRGAAVIAFAPTDDRLLVGGEWGVFMMEAPRETT